MLTLFCACGPTASSVCQQQCDKRVSCGGSLDLAQCKRACEGSSVPAGTCGDANLALQACQVAQPCDAYLAGTGCDAELRAAVDDCR
jgi:hypothetical protein